MRRGLPACVLLLVAGLLPSAGARGASEAPIVIVLSLDGVRHDYLDWDDFPALGRMAREGALGGPLVPPFPSVTFPGHVTLATGTHPDRHGIVANEFWDGERRYDRSGDASWLEAEPLWVTAERQGVRSAVFFWVLSGTDWRGRGATYRKTPFDSHVGEAEKVDQLLAWLDLPEPERPRLLMSWWHGADRVGHDHGPRRRPIVRQLAEQDEHLDRLLSGLDARHLWPRTTLIVVSDHGMSLATRNVDVEGPLARAGVRAKVQRAGGAAFVYLDDPGDLAAARAALTDLRDVEVYAADEIPARLRVRHARRTGDLLLLARPPATFGRVGGWNGVFQELARLFGRGIGMHGYDPEHPEMGGIFLALGRGVPAGSRFETVHSIDVAPSVAALLGIDAPAQSEGRPLLGGDLP